MKKPEVHYGNKTVSITVVHEITNCKFQCPYFGQSMDGMYCKHPQLKDKPITDVMIINNSDDILNGFPPLCPLFYTGY